MGAQLRVYRQKIRSAQTTKKITRAMELISASRIQKARRGSRPPVRTRAPSRARCRRWPPLEHRPRAHHGAGKVERAAMLIFASDRGLAGAFNSNVLERSEELASTAAQPGQGRRLLPGRPQGGRVLLASEAPRCELGLEAHGHPDR